MERLANRLVNQAEADMVASVDASHAAFVRARPALILTDIQLPGMNGIDALRRLRADPVTRAIPVIP